jgi:hypothetical protein
MKMKNIYLAAVALFLLFAACDDDSDMAIKRVASPVTLEVEESDVAEITVTVFELDKSGILDNTVGIVSTPVPDLPVEVLYSGVSIGTFTTDISGKVVVSYLGSKPNEFAGTYKGIAFRIKK